MSFFCLLGRDSSSSDAIQDGSLPQEVAAESSLLGPDCDFGTTSVDNIGSWMRELG